MGCCVSRPQPSPTTHHRHRPHFVSVGNNDNEQNQATTPLPASAEEPSVAAARKIAQGDDAVHRPHEAGSPRGSRHDVMPKVKFVVVAASDFASSLASPGVEPTDDENINGRTNTVTGNDKKLSATHTSHLEGSTAASLNDSSFHLQQSNTGTVGGDDYVVGDRQATGAGGSVGGAALVSGMDSSLGDSFLPPSVIAGASSPSSGRADNSNAMSRCASGSAQNETNHTDEIDIAHACTTTQDDSGANTDVGASSTSSLRKVVPRVKYVPQQSPPAAAFQSNKGSSSVDGVVASSSPATTSTATTANANKGVHDNEGNALVEMLNYSRGAQTSYHDSLLGSQPPMPRSTATTIPYASLSAGMEQMPAIPVRSNDHLDAASPSPLA